MKIRYALVALAFACTGDLDGKTGDTGPGTEQCPDGRYQGPINIVGAEVTCTGSTARFAAETEGLTGDGWVYAQETGNQEPQWAENHTITTYEFDTCGYYDRLDRTVQDGTTLNDPINDWQRDTSSVFTCDAHYNDNGVMTFAFGVMDQAGNLADCFAFGDDVDGMKSGAYDVVGEDPEFSLSDCEEGQEGV